MMFVRQPSQFVNQPANQPPRKFSRQPPRFANKAANQTTNQQARHLPGPINNATKQTTSQATSGVASHPTRMPTTHQASQLVNRPQKQPLRQPTSKPYTQPTETSASASASSRPPPSKVPTTQWFSCSQPIFHTPKKTWDTRKPLFQLYTQTPLFILTQNTGLDLDKELLYILQPLRGFIPPRVIGRSHLISYGRGGLRAKTFGAMFSIRGQYARQG